MATPPDFSPPPLTRWQWTWRNLVAVASGALAGTALLPAAWDQNRLLFWIDMLTGLTCLVLYQFRRRWPFPIVLLVNTIGALASTAVGVVTLSLISLATRRRWREILPVAAVNIVGGLIFFRVQSSDDGWYVDAVLTVVVAAAAVAIGLYIGARRELVATLKDRAERAEREQAMRLAQARANERAQIAREMHDVLAHRISLVAMHAGALAFRTDLSAEETAEAAGVIQANAHRALADLREILGLLRETDGEVPHRPQPTLRNLEALVEEERVAGAHIRLANRIASVDAVPESVGRNAYRMIQETLTNARKHAPDTTIDVELSGRPGEGVTMNVRNPVRVGAGISTTPGAGLGLIGLAERAALSGGRLEHELTAGGDFVVRAWLPWPP